MFKMISSLIGKVKKLVEDYQTNKWWNSLTHEEQRQWLSGDTAEQVAEHERLMQEAGQLQADYLREQAEEREKLRLEILEEKRLETLCDQEFQRLRDIDDDLRWNQEHCHDCGELHRHCHCHLDEEGVCEITLIQRQCAETDNQEDVPQWLEEANTPCPTCGLLPEFCQCQYEE